MSKATTSVIPQIIDRHAEDAAFLWLQRDAAVKEPHYTLTDLVELDDRLNSHLDGLSVAAELARAPILKNLEFAEPGEVFVTAWYMMEQADGELLDTLLSHCTEANENYRALLSGIAWHPSSIDFAKILLKANAEAYQQLGYRLHALFRIRPALNVLEPACISVNKLRMVGELGLQELLADLDTYIDHTDAELGFWANWSAALLGNWQSVARLVSYVLQQHSLSLNALAISVRKLSVPEQRNLLGTLSENPETMRLAMQGMGYSGDPFWLPMLLTYMDELELARTAGEAFTLITGLDLAYLDMDKDWPDGFESGPNEDPTDDNVELDADLNLPWPDAAKINGWWQTNADKFTPGQRYLCGKPISKSQCYEVLKNGYQKQRHAAAIELALMGEPYFNVCAPGAQQLTKLKAIA